MADAVVATPAAPPAAAPKKVAAKKSGAAKKPAVKANHPPTSDMVNAAIAALKEKKGSSLQAIKKYIAATYKIDVEKQSTFIKKYIKSAVTKKTIVQTKGSGASGRFKLAPKGESEKKVVKKPAVKKVTSQKKVTAAKKSPAVQKVTVAKKQSVKKTVAAKPKAPKPVKAKSPSKAKKSGKAPATKPKTPKPKKVAAPKVKAVKK